MQREPNHESLREKKQKLGEQVSGYADIVKVISTMMDLFQNTTKNYF